MAMTPYRYKPATAQAAQQPVKCAAIGCQHHIQPGFLMCADHWRQVPVAIRRQVLQTHRELRRGTAFVAAYRQAVAAAVDAVHGKQSTAKARRDAQTKPLF
jgi:hypothetical protein